MPKFRKKPVEIEAFQWGRHIGAAPDWFIEASNAGHVTLGPLTEIGGQVALIRTLEGQMTANMGDWIIRGVKGEIYPCKPDIFAATYDPVD